MNLFFAKTKILTALLLIGALLIVSMLLLKAVRSSSVVQQFRGRQTIESVLQKYGDQARIRLKARFEKASATYPPAGLILLGLKAEKELQVYSLDAQSDSPRFVCSFPILGTSGVLGPKLREGDKQMPEGFYRISELEPNTPYHVAMRVDYPNEFDKEMGKRDGRATLGGDIMIHGADCSIGCLAMGDPASEELFVLVHDVGNDKTELIMSPFDFRHPPNGIDLPQLPEWINGVYSQLKAKVKSLPSAVKSRNIAALTGAGAHKP